MERARSYRNLQRRIKLILHDQPRRSTLGFRRMGRVLEGGGSVAILEGDDLWTDPLKLQKQVDLLCVDPHVGGMNLELLPHLDALSGHKHSARLAARRKELLDTGFQAAIGVRDLSIARSRWKRMWKERAAAGYVLRELARNFVIAYLPGLAGWLARKHMAQ